MARDVLALMCCVVVGTAASGVPPGASSVLAGPVAGRGAAFVSTGALTTGLMPCRLGVSPFEGGRALVGARLAAPRRDHRQGLIGTSAILDKFAQGVNKITEGLTEVIAGPEKQDILQLREALGDQEFEAVKDLVSRLMAQQRKEVREVKAQSAAEQKKLQREVRGQGEQRALSGTPRVACGAS